MTTCSTGLLNYLTLNRATLNILKLPDVSFTITNFRLPGISLPTPIYETPTLNLPLGGDQPIWEPLTVTYIVDEYMKNWNSTFELLTGTSAADEPGDYIGDLEKYTESYIIVYDSNNKPFMKVVFENCVITEIGGIEFSEQATQTEYVTSSLTLQYLQYRVEYSV